MIATATPSQMRSERNHRKTLGIDFLKNRRSACAAVRHCLAAGRKGRALAMPIVTMIGNDPGDRPVAAVPAIGIDDATVRRAAVHDHLRVSTVDVVMMIGIAVPGAEVDRRARVTTAQARATDIAVVAANGT